MSRSPGQNIMDKFLYKLLLLLLERLFSSSRMSGRPSTHSLQSINIIHSKRQPNNRRSFSYASTCRVVLLLSSRPDVLFYTEWQEAAAGEWTDGESVFLLNKWHESTHFGYIYLSRRETFSSKQVSEPSSDTHRQTRIYYTNERWDLEELSPLLPPSRVLCWLCCVCMYPGQQQVVALFCTGWLFVAPLPRITIWSGW